MWIVNKFVMFNTYIKITMERKFKSKSVLKCHLGASQNVYRLLFTCICYVFAMGLVSCEKGMLDVDGGSATDEHDGGTNVVLSIASIEQIPFMEYEATRAAQEMSFLCSRISFVVFQGDNKVKTVTQSVDEPGFGKVSLSLAEGTYSLVVIAHSCSGNATVSTPQLITFPNNRVSDTFYICQDINVGAEEKSYDLQLRRSVAMFRLVVNDGVPADVAQIKFYYTGGSSTFDATTGRGCKNSRQTVVLDASPDLDSYDVYTFPHEETDELKITVTALDRAGNTVVERVFEDVPVRRNMITKYVGDFFHDGGNAGAGQSIQLFGDVEWQEQLFPY